MAVLVAVVPMKLHTSHLLVVVVWLGAVPPGHSSKFAGEVAQVIAPAVPLGLQTISFI